MIKKKFIFVFLAFLTIISLLCTFVYATEDEELTEELEEEVAVDEEIEDYTEDIEDDTEYIDEEIEDYSEDVEDDTETYIEEGDVYILSGDATIDYSVDGNVFIIGDNVTISSYIGGDVFVIANSVTITEDGYVMSNLFAIANTISIEGTVYNIYTISNNLTIDGMVYRDIKSMADNIAINGTVGRDAYLNCSSLSFTKSEEDDYSIASYGYVYGNLSYSSENELDIPEDSVEGTISYIETSSSFGISTYIYSLGGTIVLALVVWLVILWLSSRFDFEMDNTFNKKKILTIVISGILLPIILAIASIILMLISITTSVGVILLLILALLIIIGSSLSIVIVNDIICKKFNVTANIGKVGALILTALIFWVITLIPYLGTLVSFVAGIWGIGTITYMLFFDKQKLGM